MKYGKKNLVFGFIYLIFTLSLGILISVKFKLDPSFAEKPFAFPRVIMRAAHAHGNLESVLNIIVGLLIDNLKLADGMKKAISILIIFGAIMHSGMLYIAPVIPFTGDLAVIGALTLVATMLLMAYAIIKGMEKGS